MARRYVRDNRGRFASVGATARGGRLRTAAGNKRKTQTMRSNAAPKSTVAKPKGLKPNSIKPKAVASKPTRRFRPGELMNANGRPVNTMAKPRKGQNPFINGSTTVKDRTSRLANAKTAAEFARKRGHNVAMYSGAKHVPARYNETTGTVEINRAATHWQNPRASAIAERRGRFWSSSSPVGSLYHEMGHSRAKGIGNSWLTASRGGTYEQKLAKGSKARQLAGRVSRYAQTSPNEFVAETYAGLRTGRRYDYQVMRAYREAQGLSPKPASRRRSRIKRK